MLQTAEALAIIMGPNLASTTTKHETNAICTAFKAYLAISPADEASCKQTLNERADRIDDDIARAE